MAKGNAVKSITAGVVVLCLCGLVAYVRAQNVPAESDPTKRLQQIEDKLNQILVNQTGKTGDVSKKLELILANQEKIIKELAIIKVRATR